MSIEAAILGVIILMFGSLIAIEKKLGQLYKLLEKRNEESNSTKDK